MTDQSADKPKSKQPAPDPGRPAKWLSGWKKFVERHPAWVERLPIGESVYILPEPIVEELASPRGGHRLLRPLISKQDADAERDFARTCEQAGPWVVGVCAEGPLHFPLLFESWNDTAKSFGATDGNDQAVDGEAELESSVDDKAELEVIRRDRAEAKAISDQIVVDHQRQLAYAGLLSFHQPYRLELEQLKEKWRSWPEPKPRAGPWWPATVELESNAVINGTDYYRLYETFRARWHLSMLVSWDLPWPSARGEALTLRSVRWILGQVGEFDYCPPFLDTPRKTIIEKEISRQRWFNILQEHPEQAKVLRDHPVSAELFRDQAELPSMRGIVERGSGPSEHETAFRMWLVELTVRRHYGDLHGLTAAIIRGFAAVLSLSEDHVKRLRTAYLRFLKP